MKDTFISYTMHNIILPDGRESLPGKPVLAETADVKEMIAFAKSHFLPLSMVTDLGAGEGGYAIAFARAGYTVVAVEPRKENIKRMEAAARADDRLIIAATSVEQYLTQHSLAQKGLYLCLGLLYHLPDPAATLAQIAARCDGLILSTHYALERHWPYDLVPPGGSWLLKRVCKRLPRLFYHQHFGLSKITRFNGRAGRWYPEYAKGRVDVSDLTHSSVHNHRSFWLTIPEILDICWSAGLSAARAAVKWRQQNFTAYFERK